MMKVCIFGFPKMEDFHGYAIDSLDPRPYFPRHLSFRDFFASVLELGAGAASFGDRGARQCELLRACSLDRLYREREPHYMRFVDDFVAKFRDADIIVLPSCPIHPEVLAQRLPGPIKVLGFIDQPGATYGREIPYLWAFDGAIYNSPSYNEHRDTGDALALWGAKESYWFPWVTPQAPSAPPTRPEDFWPHALAREEAERWGSAFFRDRDVELVYIGNYNREKLPRLVELKRHFGSRFRVHGRWQMRGYRGYLGPLFDTPMFASRVTSLSNEERRALYLRTRICINIHVSPVPRDTGNMRMYEAPAHGIMMVCDKGSMGGHAKILEPGREAVFFDSIPEAIEKIEYYLRHDAEREAIARAGFERVHRDYDGAEGLKKLLDWAGGLRARASGRGALHASGVGVR